MARVIDMVQVTNRLDDLKSSVPGIDVVGEDSVGF